MVTPITNVRGSTIGRVIVLHDISKHVRQQQRLEVLNRILRHNIRTETNIIHGYVDRFPDDENARIVKKRALRIEEIGRKGREAIELFDERRERSGPQSLVGLVERCVASVHREYPAVAIEFERPDDDIAVSGLLHPVLSNVIENAAEHNTGDDPHVWITVRTENGRVSVEVADNGPGIDEYELRVLAEGTETALNHGSGLGLWIAKWGTDIADGELRFVDNEPTGTVVTVEVPILSREADDATSGV
jgi:signal transduction histidine kinase